MLSDIQRISETIHVQLKRLIDTQDALVKQKWTKEVDRGCASYKVIKIVKVF